MGRSNDVSRLDFQNPEYIYEEKNVGGWGMTVSPDERLVIWKSSKTLSIMSTYDWQLIAQEPRANDISTLIMS